MKNKSVILLTIIIILGMIIPTTIYKVYTNHNQELIKVVEEEFLYQATNCYNKDICKNASVTLKDLYQNNYLKDKLTNPITKKYYSEESYVNIKTNEIKLID